MKEPNLGLASDTIQQRLERVRRRKIQFEVALQFDDPKYALAIIEAYDNALSKVTETKNI